MFMIGTNYIGKYPYMLAQIYVCFLYDISEISIALVNKYQVRYEQNDVLFVDAILKCIFQKYFFLHFYGNFNKVHFSGSN